MGRVPGGYFLGTADPWGAAAFYDPLCTTRCGDGLYSCGCGPAFHKYPPRFTGVIGAAVEDVGKSGSGRPQTGEFSNHPDLHNRVLENRAVDQLFEEQELPLLFHFSCENYGGYCLCSNLLPTFLTLTRSGAWKDSHRYPPGPAPTRQSRQSP